MDEEVFGAEEDFEISVKNESQDPKDKHFNNIVMVLQEFILDEEFQSTQSLLLRENCGINLEEDVEVTKALNKYSAEVGGLLEKNIQREIQEFCLHNFAKELETKRGQVDEEIYEVILSLVSLEHFRCLLGDYRASVVEEERYKTLTIKTNKIPQNKKVKGSEDNIFGSSQPNFGKGSSKKAVPKQTKISEKTIEEVFVPETVLTVKGLRKN